MTNSTRLQYEITNLKNEGDPVIQFKDVSLMYRTLKKKSKVVLTNINVSFYEGDLVALVGNNGAGKSSFIKSITSIVKPNEGEVIVKGATS